MRNIYIVLFIVCSLTNGVSHVDLAQESSLGLRVLMLIVSSGELSC